MRNFVKTALLQSAKVCVFENTAGWKLDENGAVVMKDGNPVWVNADGQEGTIAIDTISRLNAEAKANRIRAEQAEAALKPFEGLDPAEARKAIDTLKTVDLEKMVDSGQIETVRNEIKSQYEKDLAERDKQLNDVTGQLHSTLLNSAFASSKFIAENIAVPADMLMATFAKNFKVDGSSVVAIGSDGNPLYSKTRYGEVADFDEALGLLVESYPHKDSILKAPSGGGTGNSGAGGNGGGPAKFIKRSDFATKPPHEQAAIAAAAKKGEMQIVD